MGEVRTEKAWRGLRDKQQSETRTEGVRDIIYRRKWYSYKYTSNGFYSGLFETTIRNLIHSIAKLLAMVKGNHDFGIEK